MTGVVSATSTTTGNKTTICHQTGNGRFVQITVNNHALPAHRRHGDIVPAPAGGCTFAGTSTAVPSATGTSQPTTTTTPQATTTGTAEATMTGTPTPATTETAAPTETGTAGPAVTAEPSATTGTGDLTAICHRTGNGGFVQLTVNNQALEAHSRHTGDIIPAPEGGCPSQ
jgi:hypothetical protein